MLSARSRHAAFSILFLVPFRLDGSNARTGNEITAMRWRRLSLELGYVAELGTDGTEGRFDVLFALHAIRSYEGIRRFAARNLPSRIVLALTGTDINSPDGSATRRHRSHQSMAFAHRIVVLNDGAVKAIPTFISRSDGGVAPNDSKTHVIHQSARVNAHVRDERARRQHRSGHSDEPFRIVQLSHLRAIKAPFMLPEALQRLPDSANVLGLHAGAEIETGLAAVAADWQAQEPRYRYLGALAHSRAIELLADADLLVLTSLSEGGPNVLAEALVHGVPVVTTPTEAAESLLGEDYPGFVPFDSPSALAQRLELLMRHPDAFRALAAAAQARKYLADEATEKRKLATLLDAICATGA